MTDLTTYVPPGVYVEDRSRELADAINPVLGDYYLCLVAPAQGYVTATETRNLFSATATVLANTGVVQTSVRVKSASSTPLVADTDYALTEDTTTTPGVTLTSILRLPAEVATPSPGGLVEGGQVTITYQYVDSTYFQPQTFTDFSALARVYGPALSNEVGAADPVVSPLSLAAQVAFENGASRVMTVAVDPDATTTRDGFKTAYDLIANDHRISVLVPIFPEADADNGSGLSSLLTDLRLHVDATSANGFGRMVLASGSGTYDDVTDPFEEVAEGVANKRIVVVYPTRYTMFNPMLSQTVEVGGGYMAAALGGRLMLNEVERSLTRQQINTLTSIPALIRQKMSKAFMNSLAGSGVLVIETSRSDRLVVRHGITTDPTSLVTREISLVRVADILLQDIQTGLDNAGLIGLPIDDEMSTRVKAALTGILEQEVADNVIVNYAQVLVRQEALPNGDPSVIACQFSYRPAVPLNYITVEFTLDLNTGIVETPPDESIPTTG